MDGEGKLINWVKVAHPWAIPASASPALIGFSYVFYLHETGTLADVNWSFGVLAILGAIIFHLAGNLISEYHDYMSGVDIKEKTGPERLIVKGLFKPKTVLYYGYVVLTVGVLLGVYLLLHTGLPMLAFGFIGVISSTLYYRFKYVALGDLIIFISYGMAIALGVAYVMTVQIIWPTLLVVAPTGLLVVAILHANNTRDMLQDKAAGIRTQAMRLGVEGSQVVYQTILLLAYMLVAMAVWMRFLPSLSFVVLLSFPLVMRNIRLMKKVTLEDLGIIRFLDTDTAKLVLLFSLLLAAANFVAPFL